MLLGHDDGQMLGPREVPEGIGPSNFVHHRIIGGVTGFFGGGPAGAVTGFLGGKPKSDLPGTGASYSTFPGTVPTVGPTTPSGQPPCILPFRRDPLTGDCKIFAGTQSGPDPAPGTGVMVHGTGTGLGMMHHPHAPEQVTKTVRRCGRGHVLAWNGMCVSKKEIRNSDRMYPKPRRALGTPGDLNAVAKAASFGRRLQGNKKRLKKLERDLSKATGGR